LVHDDLGHKGGSTKSLRNGVDLRFDNREDGGVGLLEIVGELFELDDGVGDDGVKLCRDIGVDVVKSLLEVIESLGKLDEFSRLLVLKLVSKIFELADEVLDNFGNDLIKGVLNLVKFFREGFRKDGANVVIEVVTEGVAGSLCDFTDFDGLTEGDEGTGGERFEHLQRIFYF